MFIDVIDNLEDFKRVKDNWDAVYEADPEAQFFLSWTWLSQWLVAARPNWFILAAKPTRDAPSYVAFFPLRLRTKLKHGSGFHNEIGMAGNSGADYTGLICLPDAQQAILTFAKHLKTLNWARIRLENVRISGPRLRLLLAHFPPRIFNIAETDRVNTADNINNCVCPLVHLPDDWDSYLDSLSANTRQKIRRFLRMVESDGAYRITHARSDTIERDVDTLLELWSTRWGSRKGERLNAMVKSSRTVLLNCFEDGALLLPVLWREETPLGALAIYVDRRKAAFLFFIAGRDDSVHNPPPGLVLHAHSIRYAIAHGFKTYDFLRGNEAYKYSFGARERRIHCIAISTKTERNLGDKLDRRSVPAVMQYVAELHGRGNLAEAERGYRQILAIEPAHQAARHGLDRVRAGTRDHGAPPRDASPAGLS